MIQEETGIAVEVANSWSYNRGNKCQKKSQGQENRSQFWSKQKKVLQKIEELMLESIFQPLKNIPRFAIVKFFDSIDRLIEQVNFFQLNAEPN